MKEIDYSTPANFTPSQEHLKSAASKTLGIPVKEIRCVVMRKRSIDARSREVVIRYKLQVYTISDPFVEKYKPDPYQDVSKSRSVIIIGAGPAGLFAALKLLQSGIKPIIIERGSQVSKRKRDVALLSREGVLNPDSNYCFGEGGAGTFSDGKLYTRSTKRGDIREVLYQLTSFGANPDILIDSHPHIGSDRLPSIMERIRETITGCGGEYHFDSRVVDLNKKGELWQVKTSKEIFESESVIIATGHSAEDIYHLFHTKGWELEAKGFALGVRAEHPQELIDDIQYKKRYADYLPHAEYSLVESINGRGVFSFCMCPGGILIPSMTSSDEIVLNGMSNSLRNSRWANSGIVVQVDRSNLPPSIGDGELSLLHYRKEIEKSMFDHTRSFKAPAQRITDFVKDRLSANLPSSSYHPGLLSSPLSRMLPTDVSSLLKEAFIKFDKKMRGYYTSEAIVAGVESRTSSPVRIPRDPLTLQHVTQKGLYPCGEGAGYSGGIISSAIDGINCASAIAASAT